MCRNDFLHTQQKSMNKIFKIVVFAVVAAVITAIIVLNKQIIQLGAKLSPTLKKLFVQWAWMKDDSITTAQTSPLLYASGGGGSTVVTSGIVLVNQSLATVLAGATGVTIPLTLPTINGSCADTNSRTLLSIGAGISIFKNGLPLLVNQAFLKTDALTYSVNTAQFPNNTTYSNQPIMTYKAIGACGDSNTAIITANVVRNALTAFTIKDAWLNGSNYEPYATLVDAMDKNFENSGFTNRNATIYAAAMTNGLVAYTNANGTTLYPQGRYFYDTTFEYLYVNPQGVMSIFPDISKPTNLNLFTINESTQ